MENPDKEFEEFDKKSEIDSLMNKADEILRKNEELIKQTESFKAEKKKMEQPMNGMLPVETKQINEGDIMDWALETAFKLSGGLSTIQMRTLTLAELFKTIYLAGMRGE